MFKEVSDEIRGEISEEISNPIPLEIPAAIFRLEEYLKNIQMEHLRNFLGNLGKILKRNY